MGLWRVYGWRYRIFCEIWEWGYDGAWVGLGLWLEDILAL